MDSSDPRRANQETIRTTIDHAAAIDFRIRGTAFEIGVLTYDDRYQLNLCVDGKCKVHDIFTLDIHWRVPIVVSGLSDGEHSVRMTLNTDKGGKAIDLDWVRVFPSRDPLSIGTHRYDSPSIQYSPNWQNFEDFKRSHREPSVFFFDFVGAKATLRLRTADYYGETFICLDGKCEVHNLYSVSYGWRDIVLTADPGRHHVRVEKGKSRVVGLHSVVVE
jgi:hypothetical protein